MIFNIQARIWEIQSKLTIEEIKLAQNNLRNKMLNNIEI